MPASFRNVGAMLTVLTRLAAMAPRLDMPRPSDDPGRPDAAVIQRRLAAREGTAVVAEEQDQRVPGLALPVQLRHHLADVVIQPGDLVVVQRQLLADLGEIREIRRDDRILRVMRLGDGPLPGSLGAGPERQARGRRVDRGAGRGARAPTGRSRSARPPPPGPPSGSGGRSRAELKPRRPGLPHLSNRPLTALPRCHFPAAAVQ